MLIPFTDYDTKGTLYVESSKVTTIVRLSKSDNFPARTRIMINRDCVLVTETPEEVFNKIAGTA